MKLFLAILANYRMAQLFAFDDGPYDIFELLRVKAGCYRYDEQGRPDTNLGRLLKCPFCIGVWTSILCAVAMRSKSRLIQFVLLALAIAGGQTWLENTGGQKDA